MTNFMHKTFETMTQLHMLPAGSAARVFAFLYLTLVFISFLIWIISIFGYFFFKNKILKGLFFSFLMICSLFILAQGLIYLDIAVIEPNWIEVKTVNLRIPRLAPALSGIKIVQFSDLHACSYGFREKQTVRIINSLKPDIILFTGGLGGEDLRNLRDGIPPASRVLSNLKAKFGVWMVDDFTDNYLLNDPSLKKMVTDSGVKFLNNDGYKFARGKDKYFWLIGIEDSFYGANGLPKTMANLSADEPKLVITHSPDLVDKAEGYGIDLILAGKTHGGQMGIPFIRNLSDFIKDFKYLAGVYKVGNITLYVNKGIGTKTSPYRLLCRPEVTVINITD
jgi:predicted MPP superfamily phosphohydrolase